MKTEDIDLTWLDSHHKLSFEELIKLSGLSQATLQLLVENGALAPDQFKTPDYLNKAAADNPDTVNTNTWFFSGHHLVSIRTLSRLQRDFELENNSLCLIMLYLERINELEAQLLRLDSQK